MMGTAAMSPRRFGNTAPALVRAGFPVLPTEGKRPKLPAWTLPLSVAQVDALATNGQAGAGIGMLAKNFPGIDIDIRDRDCAEAIQVAAEKHFGAAPVRIGAAPKRLMMYRTDEPFTKVKVSLLDPEGDQHAIEFLGDGQQYVVYGPHPSGVEYTWPNSDGPGDTEVWDLSTITLAQVHELVQQLPQHLPPGWAVVGCEAGRTPPTEHHARSEQALERYREPLDGWDAERVERELLDHIDPDASYETWVRVGMALQHQFADTGLDLWQQWSERGAKYKDGECESKWPTFRDQRASGHGPVTLASLIKMARQARKNGPQGAVNAQTGQPAAQLISGAPVADLEALRRQVVDLSCCVTNVFTEHEFVVDSLVPMGEATLLGGHGGSGKSSLAITAAIHVALGLPFGPYTTRRTRVLIVSAEDHGDVVRGRIAKTCAALNVDPIVLEGWLFVLDLSEFDAALAVPGAHRGVLVETPTLRALGELVEMLDIGMTILDNVADVFAGDEINRREVRCFIRAVRQRLARPSRAVILLAHLSKTAAKNPSKDPEDYSGSTAWHNSVRSRLSLTADGPRLLLTHQKSNYGSLAPPLHLRWAGSVPVPVGAVAGASGEAESLKDDCRVVLKFVTDHAQRGDPVTTATQGPATTFGCAKGDPDMSEHLRLDKLRFVAVLRSLENDGRIIRQEIMKHRRARSVFVPAPGVLIPGGGEA